MSITVDYPHTKRMFGTLFAGVHFLALVQVKSTYGHERYMLRWYKVSESGSCVPGSIEDFGVPSLRRIGAAFTRRLLYTWTKGFYTVGRPSWHTVDWEMLRICKQLHMNGEVTGRYVWHVMYTKDLRVYGIIHNRRTDPFRKIRPSL